MRVTHVITRLIVGGAQENTVASVLGLQRKTGWDLNLISGPPTAGEASLASAFDAQPQMLTIIPDLVRPIHPWKDGMALRRLTRLFRQGRPDLVHTHSGKAGFLGRLAAARAGVPRIVHTIHGPSFGPFLGPIPNRVFRTCERRAGKVTSHFVAVAQAMIEQYLAAGIGRRDQYTRILSGFELDPYLSATNDPRQRARWGIAPDDIVVGCIARICKLKGHDDLLSIAPALLRECPALRFLIVGEGDWRPRITRRARALGVGDRFTFTGLVAPDEIPALAGIMDLLVHLSWREGLPRALAQALAASRPVVAYGCDGAGEICISGETGYLLRPGDLSGLTARLLELARDPGLRRELGARGQRLVRDQFGLEKMIDALYELYLKLADEPTRQRECSGRSLPRTG